MRTVLLGDIIAMARVLLALPKNARRDQLEMMIQQTDAAHKYHKRFSMPHPSWGNGSLMARANVERSTTEPFASDVDYLRVLHLTLESIIDRKIVPKDV